MKATTVVAVLAALLVGFAAATFMQMTRLSSAPSPTAYQNEARSADMMAAPAAAVPEPQLETGAMGSSGPMRERLLMKRMAPAKPAPKLAMEKKQEDAPAEIDGLDADSSGAAPAATRAWFPETFLFQPRVVTDSQGRAVVPVKVPDRLTTWHVLALAHSREGSQAGTSLDFLGTLPAYVDVVAPPFLLAGDQVRLPIQVVNTQDGALNSQLSLSAVGGRLSSTGGPVKVAAASNEVQYVGLQVDRPGMAAVKATLGKTDAVERVIPVRPSGQRVTVSGGGTLAAPRTLELSGPEHALPGSAQVRLLIFPGALSVLKSELAAAPGRGGVADDAYTLLLAGRAAGLLSSLGATPDMAAIRDVAVIAGQRAMRHGRSPDVPTAALLAEAALAHGDNAVMARLGERLAATVARAQRPDGTFAGQTGWTLQRLLVVTAECVRAVSASQTGSAATNRATAARLRAATAFQRNLARVEDGYTAATLLASGAVTGTLADELRKKVLEALSTRPDGSKVLEVPAGVVRADGLPPSVLEATATAVLALGPKAAESADLGTALLGSYHPYGGWGDGRANLVALRAVVELFKDPVPPNVRVVLERDGKEVVAGDFDPSKLQEVRSLEAEATGAEGAHAWTIRSEPAVPGLGFSLTLQAYVPWKDDAPAPGLELKAELPERLKVGEAAAVKLSVAAPAGMPTVLRLSLPAGVQPDRPGLDALVNAGHLTRYETEDGALQLHFAALSAGATFTGEVRVVPTLAGVLHADATTLMPEGRPNLTRVFKPSLWKIQ